MTKLNHRETINYGIVAGLAGGFAEIAWVTLYAGLTGGDVALPARGVAAAARLGSLFPALSVAIGIVIHMALAVSLGIALAFAWRAFSANRPKTASPFPFMVAVLVGIWAVNFFVVLPVVSPAFVHLMPYSASLISKILFGVAAAEAFRGQDASARQQAGRAFFARSVS
ncbi:MAG TPA: hypothetical protein VGP48_11950 [Stellaceae bacterium]|jgi:hypothetical protein|nr:hypothetical protein [Stellaceae bacterium]